ncbi:3-keto-disaccharide hydrolase [Fimbriiglobus ruber]|uniref:3-keto-alpha-glucoside-1,2-lyase/3-keto-2-hydroxy-glucal hydratase domain-containing protein n=1 Tax=Fimbriiglobus ruber TaxID=1908690 RepID=A0A225DAX4_9BACT|nr:DUF1080 domain-containing protein [Fimbriiglobus ruber]OWK36804.1 hypothetical protein FRUB_09367 [Fimbriiglobus ruber]
MRLSHLLAAFGLLVSLASAGRADDTKDFLDPANWEGREDLWKLDGGTIVGETKEDPKYNTFFCSKKKYGDFEMSYKVQLRDGVGNSGVQIRSVLKDPKKFVVAGPQVDAAKGYFGLLYGEGVGGYMVKPKVDAAKGKEKDFNEYHVVAKGNHIVIKVNDQVTVDEDFPDNKGKNPTPAEGIIAFQIHAGFPSMRVEFKDIKFTDLSKK